MDDHEREVFLSLFRRLATRHGWTLGTYCLMSNHYHLLMRIEQSLSDGMRELNGGFSSYTNARNGLEGHLFRNRFWCELMEDEAHYLQTARYIVLNPVRAGICATPRVAALLRRQAGGGAGGLPRVRQRRDRRSVSADTSRCQTP